MASELPCLTHNNMNDPARGHFEMWRKAKATSGCLINVVSVRSRLWVKCGPAGVTMGKMRAKVWGTARILPTCVITKAIAGEE